MWIDRVVRWLMPREDHFYDLLERGADCVRRGSALLVECCGESSADGRSPTVARLREVEHEADKVVAEVYEALNKTFVTPIDRTDIYVLATALENLVDGLFATANQFVIRALDDLPAGTVEMTKLIGEAGVAIDEAVKGLRRLKQPDAIRERCDRINRMESEGDRIYQTRLGEMFRTERDAIRLLKHKEFLEGLERTLDACDDVGNALQTIVIKNA